MPGGTFIYSFDNTGLAPFNSSIHKPIRNISGSFTKLEVSTTITSGNITTVTINFEYTTINNSDGLYFYDVHTYYTNNTVTILQFNGIPLSNGTYQFYNLKKLFIPATDKPTILPNTSLCGAFFGCTNFNTNLSNWDVSGVTNMDRMFSNASKFNNNFAPMNWNCSSSLVAPNFGLNSGLYGEGGNYNINPGNAVRIDGLTSIETLIKTFTISNSSLQVISGTFRFSISNLQFFDITKLPIINSTSFTSLRLSSSVDLSNNMIVTINFSYRLVIGDDGLSFKNVTDYYGNKTVTILQFGGIPLSRTGEQFANLPNLVISATDKLEILDNTSLYYAFYNCTNFNSTISNCDVSNVINTSYMFYGCNIFNQNIGSWNVSKVINTSYMFYNCTNFNQNIGSWIVSNVINTSYMFYGCNIFNQNIDSWNVSNIENMSSMFSYCDNFNSNISSWIVSNVTNMSYMFYNSSKFNQSLSTWNVSKVTNMTGMFQNALLFNNNKVQMNWPYHSSLTADDFGTNCALYPDGDYRINPGYGTRSDGKTIQTPIYELPKFEYTIESTYQLQESDLKTYIPIINDSHSFIKKNISCSLTTTNNKSGLSKSYFITVTIVCYFAEVLDEDGLSFNTPTLKNYYTNKTKTITIKDFGNIPISSKNEYQFQNKDNHGLTIQISPFITNEPYIPTSVESGIKLYSIEYKSSGIYSIYIPKRIKKLEIDIVSAGGSGGAGGGDIKDQSGTNGAGGGGGAFTHTTLNTNPYNLLKDEEIIIFKDFNAQIGFLKIFVGACGGSVKGSDPDNDDYNNGHNGNNGGSSCIILYNISYDKYETETSSTPKNFAERTIVELLGGGKGGGGHPTSSATPGVGGIGKVLSKKSNNLRSGEYSSGMTGGMSGYALMYPGSTYGNGGNGTPGDEDVNQTDTGAGQNGYAKIDYMT